MVRKLIPHHGEASLWQRRRVSNVLCHRISRFGGLCPGLTADAVEAAELAILLPRLLPRLAGTGSGAGERIIRCVCNYGVCSVFFFVPVGGGSSEVCLLLMSLGAGVALRTKAAAQVLASWLLLYGAIVYLRCGQPRAADLRSVIRRVLPVR